MNLKDNVDTNPNWLKVIILHIGNSNASWNCFVAFLVFLGNSIKFSEFLVGNLLLSTCNSFQRVIPDLP